MSFETLASYVYTFIVCFVVYLLFRLLYVLSGVHSDVPSTTAFKKPVKVMIILGSGGHTFEMLKMVENLPVASYSPRIYVCADSDRLSGNKAKQLEMWRAASTSQRLLLRFLSTKIDSDEEVDDDSSSGGEPEVPETTSAKMAAAAERRDADSSFRDRSFSTSLSPTIRGKDYVIERISRAREVHQSWLSTVPTMAFALFKSFPIMWRHLPDIIVCNGPATCVPIVMVAFFFAVLGIKKIPVVYVESFCRVKSLSRTGLLMYYIADHVIVQWPQLTERYKRATYHGLLV